MRARMRGWRLFFSRLRDMVRLPLLISSRDMEENSRLGGKLEQMMPKKLKSVFLLPRRDRGAPHGEQDEEKPICSVQGQSGCLCCRVLMASQPHSFPYFSAYYN